MNPRLPQAFLRLPIAHRALHDVATGCPENSRAAIRAAMARGYGIEIDVQLSADDRAMVFHDYTLDRLADGRGPIRAVPAEQLAQTVLKGGDENVPTLPEVLQLVNGQVPLLIELKDQDGAMGPDIGPLEAAVVADLKGYDGPVAIMSFNPHAVSCLAQLCPEVPRGLVTGGFEPSKWALSYETCARLREIPDFDRVGASFISHDIKDLMRPRVAELKAAGADVLCWTVKSPEDEVKARMVAQNITFEGYLAPIPG